MRKPVVAATLSCAAAAFLVLTLVPGLAGAEPVKRGEPGPCTSPDAEAPISQPRPKLADINPRLDESDEIAALEAIRVALSEVGDGGSYVWHRRHGRLSGIVQPTASFKDPAGRVCRHIVLVMTTGGQSGRVEGIACRLADGRWQLDG